MESCLDVPVLFGAFHDGRKALFHLRPLYIQDVLHQMGPFFLKSDHLLEAFLVEVDLLFDEKDLFGVLFFLDLFFGRIEKGVHLLQIIPALLHVLIFGGDEIVLNVHLNHEHVCLKQAHQIGVAGYLAVGFKAVVAGDETSV